MLDVFDGYGFPGFEALVAALQAGGLYTDIHTEKFQGGEIRGQLYPDPDELQITFLTGKKDEWRAGKTASVKFTLADAGGVRLSDAKAAGLLSPDCRVKVSATGAQEIAPGCATYNARPNEFVFNCKLERRHTGGETVTVTVSYPNTDKTTTKSESVTIVK